MVAQLPVHTSSTISLDLYPNFALGRGLPMQLSSCEDLLVGVIWQYVPLGLRTYSPR